MRFGSGISILSLGASGKGLVPGLAERHLSLVAAAPNLKRSSC